MGGGGADVEKMSSQAIDAMDRAKETLDSLSLLFVSLALPEAVTELRVDVGAGVRL